MRAKEELNGFLFLEKPLVIGYAKSKSHAYMKLDGSYEAMMFKIREVCMCVCVCEQEPCIYEIGR